MNGPAAVEIELTNACNQACGFCLRSRMTRPVGAMDLALLERLADDLARIEFPAWGKVVVAGFGEPTLHPRFAEAVSCLAERSLPLRIHTNGSRLDGPARRALLSPGVRKVMVSVGVEGDLMTRRVLGPGASWERLVQGALALLAERRAAGAGPEITLQLLSSARLPEGTRSREVRVLETPEEIRDALASWLERSGSPGPVPGPEPPGPGTVVPLGEAARVVVCPLLPYLTHFDPETSLPSGLDFGRCTRPLQNVVVFWDGSTTPCCTDVGGENSLGRIGEASLLDVWRGPAATRYREEWRSGIVSHPLCRRCLEASRRR